MGETEEEFGSRSDRAGARRRLIETTLPSGQSMLVWATIAPSTEEQDIAALDYDFQPVLDTMGHLAGALRQSLSTLLPSKATVEFGVDIAAESGKLTALLVGGSAAAHVTVTLEWEHPRS
jgi:hypothetical protein